ncbi:hypothetical protein BCR32DRAFT_324811 [Anaeromyces robustus]|uniref:Uncharacterized protein n=1 Tax=Anaeromyces robustus TaxID=1754192 RepID=A0A1Y1XLV5_9FUNG|nr:hypothetical protein BCR32DRAFT_324811 [Anaeromyces robustus]|eukprot:ORX86729.1 hypothetical protein BCR32DRAFT_324811 [Anaeromyces robustus]
METSKKKKYLIIDASNCGWGDRLIQIVSGFYVALLSKRSFKIIGVDLEKVFEKPNIDWTLDKKELERLQKSKSIKELNYLDKKYYEEGFLYTNFTSNYENYEALKYRIQNGKIVTIFENVFHKKQLYEMGLRPDIAYGCAYEYLFKPKPNVMNIVSEYYNDMEIKRDYYMSQKEYESNSKIDYLPSNDEPIRIGIQIRTGDNVFNQDESNYCKEDAINMKNIKQYFDCAQSIEDDIFKTPYNKPEGSLSMQSDKKMEKRKIYWFLITDCKLIREQAKEKWPDKIITITDKNIDHFEKEKASEESINLTIAEHWLFGEMDYHIVSRASCYGRTASLRRKIFHHIYEVEITQPYYKKCGIRDFDTFETSSKYWIEL